MTDAKLTELRKKAGAVDRTGEVKEDDAFGQTLTDKLNKALGIK